MELPKNGRVVVIDDQEEEGLALITALSKAGVSCVYFKGELEDLPENKLNSIRVIFLDIELDTQGQSDKTKLSKVKSVIDKIIDKSNGTYIIIAWTQYRPLIKKLKGILKDNPPYYVLSLEKSSCKVPATGKFSTELITTNIENELKKAGVFKVFNIWEGLISKASHSIVNDITSFYKPNKDWEKNTSRVLYKLAEAYSGRTLDSSNNSDILKNSLLAFNSVFFDTVENVISAYSWSSDPTDIESTGKIDTIPLSKINTKLHIVVKPKNSLNEPGTVYFVSTNKKFKKEKIIEFYTDTNLLKQNYAASVNQNLSNIVDADSKINEAHRVAFLGYKKKIYDYLFKNMSVIKIEVSPQCDFIQSKKTVHRFILGTLWPHKYINLIKSRTDFLYLSPAFYIRSAPHHIVIDMRYASSLKLGTKIKSEVAFKIRHELLVEIQNTVSRYLSRPGVLFLDHRL